MSGRGGGGLGSLMSKGGGSGHLCLRGAQVTYD